MEFSYRRPDTVDGRIVQETLFNVGHQAWIRFDSYPKERPMLWDSFANEKAAEAWIDRRREHFLAVAYQEAIEEDNARPNKVEYQVIAYGGPALGWVDFGAAQSSVEHARALVALNSDTKGEFRIVRRTTTQEFVD